MTVIQKRLVGPVTLSTIADDYYTVPQNTVTIVKEITLCNYSSSTCSVKIYCKVAGESLSDSHIFMNDLSLSSDETVSMSTSLVLNNTGSTAGPGTSDQIIALCNTSNSVNIIVNGLEEF